MFKSVEYLGFEREPELRALAERGQRTLEGEVRTWRDEVEVIWEAVTDSAAGRGMYLELRLKLPTSTGVFRRLLLMKDFADDFRIRRVCRDVWVRLLEKHREQYDARFAEYLAQPVET